MIWWIPTSFRCNFAICFDISHPKKCSVRISFSSVRGWAENSWKNRNTSKITVAAKHNPRWLLLPKTKYLSSYANRSKCELTWIYNHTDVSQGRQSRVAEKTFASYPSSELPRRISFCALSSLSSCSMNHTFAFLCKQTHLKFMLFEDKTIAVASFGK